MYDSYMHSGAIMIICFAIIFVVLTVLVLLNNKEMEYEIVEIEADPLFTFWNVYENSEYYQTMSYGEALAIFKEDNNMTEYYVGEWDKVKIRVKKGE